MGGVIIVITRGMGELMYGLSLLSRPGGASERLVVQWVGVLVLKIFLLDIRVCSTYKDCEEQREGDICMKQIEYLNKRPSSLLPQSSVQKGRTYFQELTVLE